MAISDKNVKAIHLEGGNYFDDMRINIAVSHRRFINLTRNAKNIRRPKYQNIIKFYLSRMALGLDIHELLVVNGIKRQWFDDFRDYWSTILNGRPFWNILSFLCSFMITENVSSIHLSLNGMIQKNI